MVLKQFGLDADGVTDTVKGVLRETAIPPPSPIGIVGIDDWYICENGLKHKRYFQTGYLFEPETACETA
jgi:hypothetical protein